MFKVFNKKEIRFINKGEQYKVDAFSIKSTEEFCISISKKDIQKLNELYKKSSNNYIRTKIEELILVGFIPYEDTKEFVELIQLLESIFENPLELYKEISTVKKDTDVVQVSKKLSSKILNLYYNGQFKGETLISLWDLAKFGVCKKTIEIIDVLKKYKIKFSTNILKSLNSTFEKILHFAKLNLIIFKKRATHIASVSGGKDSCYMVLKMLQKGMPLDQLLFIDTGLEFPEMYSYLEKFEGYIGMKIKRIQSKTSFKEEFYRIVSTGKNKGKIYGWPYILGAWCNSRLKVTPLKKYLNNIGEYISYIGIAYNEPDRYYRLKINEIAPLYDMKITEKQVIVEMNKLGILNPLYKKFDRLGCYLCPKQNIESLRTVRREYPDLWSEMLEFDKHSSISFKPNATLCDLDKRFAQEETPRFLLTV